jgi:hypothetical protein
MKERGSDVVEAVGRLPLAIEIAANRAKLWGVDPVWKRRRDVSAMSKSCEVAL